MPLGTPTSQASRGQWTFRRHSGAFQPVYAGRTRDGFLTKLSPSGSSLVYSTFLGGSGDDGAGSLALGSDGSAYVAGATSSTDFPTANPIRASLGGPSDAFVAKFNPEGSALTYSTYLGGSDRDPVEGLVVDTNGRAIVVGSTGSADFPNTTPAVFVPGHSFFTRLNSSGQLDYSSPVGNGNISVAAVAVDSSGDAYLAGESFHGVFAISPAELPRDFGFSGVLVSKIDLSSETDAPTISSVVNGANFESGPVAPGEIVTIRGSGLGPVEGAIYAVDNSGRVGDSLGGTQVLFDRTAAPILFAQAGQINTVVPYGVDGQAVTAIQVERAGQRSNTFTLTVAEAAPAIFTLSATGSGQGAILNRDLSVNSPSNPAARGSTVAIYATGEGQTEPPGVDGLVAPLRLPLPQPRLPVNVTIGGVEAEVVYAGGAPGLLAGVVQVNARVPIGITPGDAVEVKFVVGPRVVPGQTRIRFPTTLAVNGGAARRSPTGPSANQPGCFSLKVQLGS